MNGYWTVRQAATAWGSKTQWVSLTCRQKRVPGALKHGRAWAIPEDTPKPLLRPVGRPKTVE